MRRAIGGLLAPLAIRSDRPHDRGARWIFLGACLLALAASSELVWAVMPHAAGIAFLSVGWLGLGALLCTDGARRAAGHAFFLGDGRGWDRSLGAMQSLLGAAALTAGAAIALQLG